MNEVRINKEKLVAILTENKATHVTEFNEAIAGYWQMLVATLDKLRERAAVQDVEPSHIHGILHMTKPVSHEKDYNTAIRMLELSEDPYVIVSEEEFKQYVEDDWAWKQAFVGSTSMYKGK